MKRTIQGLVVVTSVLLAGCAGSSIDLAPKRELTSSVSARQLTETRENLTGICTAITRYGLPNDEQTRDYVRGKIEMLTKVAEEQPDLESRGERSAPEILDLVAAAYDRCDPEMGSEIRSGIAEMDSAGE